MERNNRASQNSQKVVELKRRRVSAWHKIVWVFSRHSYTVRKAGMFFLSTFEPQCVHNFKQWCCFCYNVLDRRMWIGLIWVWGGSSADGYINATHFWSCWATTSFSRRYPTHWVGCLKKRPGSCAHGLARRPAPWNVTPCILVDKFQSFGRKLSSFSTVKMTHFPW
jgi:hypothetical protein